MQSVRPARTDRKFFCSTSNALLKPTALFSASVALLACSSIAEMSALTFPINPHSSLILVQGDLTEFQGDAIVNAGMEKPSIFKECDYF
jgi:hypothetical protein